MSLTHSAPLFKKCDDFGDKDSNDIKCIELLGNSFFCFLLVVFFHSIFLLLIYI